MNNIFGFNVAGRSFKINLKKNNIESISLYGSYALNTQEAKSDIDLLIIIDDCTYSHYKKIERNILSELNVPKNWVSLYTKKNFAKACSYQEYFLWHLRLESKLLYSRSHFTKSTLGSIPMFTHVEDAIRSDIRYVQDYYSRYRSKEISSVKMISVMAGRLRNTFILLCFIHGHVDFGKFSTAKICFDISTLSIPFTFSDYKQLYFIKQKYAYGSRSRSKTDYDYYISSWYHLFLKLNDTALDIYSRKKRGKFRNPLLKFSQKKRSK